MPVPFTRTAALSVAVVLSGLPGIEAYAQQDTLQVDIGSVGGLTVIENGRPVISGPLTSGVMLIDPATGSLGPGQNNRLFIGRVEDAIPTAPSPEQRRRSALSSADRAESGLSDTFFIRRVPEGTTEFAPFDFNHPAEATVDTWTEQIMTNGDVSGAPTSPVTMWTGTVYGAEQGTP